MNQIGKAVKTGNQIVVKNFAIPAVDALVLIHPEWLPVWFLTRGFFGTLFDLQQEKINEFAEFIQNNSEVFTREVLGTKEFQEGFVITFENYLKQRGERKRRIIQRIFFGFTASKDKENFELERMYDVLSSISLEGVEFLKVMKKEIIPLIEQEAMRGSEHMMKNKESSRGKNKEYWFRYYKVHQSIRGFLKANVDDLGYIKRDENLSELVNLGVLRETTIGTVSSHITNFGYAFLNFIEDSSYHSLATID